MTLPLQASDLQIGDRIQYSDSRGTIRYIGEIEGRGTKQWAGVQWDDASRGKHSGTFGGRVYFACAPGAGSFLKLEKLGNGGRKSLIECVQKRYTEDALDTSFRESEVVVGGALVSIEDSDERRRRQVALARLQVVDVSGMGVASVKEDSLEQLLPELQELRVAKSLFSGLHCVMEALEAFPHLRILDASRNVLEESLVDSGVVDQERGKNIAGRLEELVLNHCVVTWETVSRLCQVNANLSTLRLHNCKLGAIDGELQVRDKLNMLQTLDLDSNELGWGDIVGHIGKLENLREVYLSNNKLCDTNLDSAECFAKVETLSLAQNAMEGWMVITWLQKLPELKQLRIRGNPVTGEEERDDREARLTWRMRVVGRIGGLEFLDGSAISGDERILCEKRYLYEEIGSKLTEDVEARRREHPRAAELYGRYGPGSSRGDRKGMRKDMVRVKLMSDEKVVARRRSLVREMPRGAEMSRVRAVGKRLLGIEAENCVVGVVCKDKDEIEWETDLLRSLSFWSGSEVDVNVVIAPYWKQ